MKTVTITVEYNEGMKMPVTTMTDNIKYVLNEHFKEMDSYSTIVPPKVKDVKVN